MMELTILDTLQAIHTPLLDQIMVGITHLGDAGILWILLNLALLIYPKTRRIGICVLIAILLEAFVSNLVLKPLVARIRPYEINTAIELLIPAQQDYSFPSGHTGISFAVAAALYLKKSRLWIPSLIMAVLIAFSRMYLYVHYPTDILGGIVIGIGCAFLACQIQNYMEKKTPVDKNKTPAA